MAEQFPSHFASPSSLTSMLSLLRWRRHEISQLAAKPTTNPRRRRINTLVPTLAEPSSVSLPLQWYASCIGWRTQGQ